MVKFKLYLDKDTETEWLNEMSAKGWAMTHFFAGFYTFEKCECGKYIYQVDFGEKLFAVSDGYREFMQDTGVEIVQTWGYWVILRRLATEGKFELYTDVESSIEHYSKIRKMFKAVAIVELACMLMELMELIVSKNPYMFILVVLPAAFAVALFRMVLHTTDIIEKLKARK